MKRDRRMKRGISPITIIVIIGLILVVGAIAFEIYIFKTYANMPASEVPFWVWWFLLGRGKN